MIDHDRPAVQCAIESLVFSVWRLMLGPPQARPICDIGSPEREVNYVGFASFSGVPLPSL